MVWRSGSELELTITLDEKPREEAKSEDPAANMPSGGAGSQGGYSGGNGGGVYGGIPEWFFNYGFGG